MALPDLQRFKFGSQRDYIGLALDGTSNPVNLSLVTGLIAKVRKQNAARSTAVSLPVGGTLTDGTFTLDFSSLSVGFYYLEIEYTDTGGKFRQLPENAEGVEIEIFRDVG